jgi:flagellar biosynthesis/type III secretory pathway M-ring protein FliF/YscJ
MSLSDLAALGSFISGVAVLASLVFLFFQMRQMTEQVRQSERNQRALMQQGRSMRGMETNRPVGCCPWSAATTM